MRPLALISGLMLTAILIGCGSSSGPEPTEGQGQAIFEAEARALYIRKCSLCHGDDGKLMASKSPDLSVSTMTLAERVALITYGKGTMPAQKGILNKAEILAVARYIDRFRD